MIVDATPEAMAQAMTVKPRGITLTRDELHGWILDFGRYAKSGEQQNMISTWSQQPFKINRKSGENEFIKEPFINVTGGIQTGLLSEMAKDNRTINGFLPRFCFVFPDNIEPPRYITEELSEDLKSKYRQYIENLTLIDSYRRELRLSWEAEQLYEVFYNKNAELNGSGKQPDYLNEVNSKLNIILLRAAILLHISQWACSGENINVINACTMQEAISLSEYFRITAKKVHTVISQNGSSQKDVARYLETLGNSQTEIAKVLKVSQPYVNKILKK
jgi:hypothetical protein